MSLRVSSLSVFLNGKRILSNVSFDLRDNLLICGPNGSGKSTLLRALMGTVRAEGSVKLDGEEIIHLPPHERFKRGIVLVPERMRIVGNLTVEENIAIAGDPEQAFELFPELAAKRETLCKYLSGGERQMVSIARGIAAGGKILLLDEPLVALHPKVKDRVIDFLGSRRGWIVVSHELERFLNFADELLLLVGGRVEYYGDCEGGAEVLRKFGMI